MAWVFEFLFRFPTVVYTILVGLVSIYWLLVQSGMLRMGLDKVNSSNHTLDGFLSFFGIARMPLPTVFSLIIVIAWVMTMILAEIILVSFALSGTPLGYGLGVVILLGAMFVSLALLGYLYKPKEKPSIPVKTKRKKPIFVGKICRITSAAVDERFGEAEFDEEGWNRQLHVRCQAPTRIKRGESALIIEYDKEKDVYWVEPYTDPLV